MFKQTVSTTKVARSSRRQEFYGADCLPLDTSGTAVYCKCLFVDDLSMLECHNDSIKLMPTSLWHHPVPSGKSQAPLLWNYVKVSSRQLRGVRQPVDDAQWLLANNANLHIAGSHRQLFDDAGDLFALTGDNSATTATTTSHTWTLVVHEANLSALGEATISSAPFRRARLKSLELVSCSTGRSVNVRAFEKAHIGTLVIECAEASSWPLHFHFNEDEEERHGTSLDLDIRIEKLEIRDVHDTYARNSPDGQFGLTGDVLNERMFAAHLVELHVVNTKLDYIDSAAVERLTRLATLRLSNVKLKTIIENTFDSLASSSLVTRRLQDNAPDALTDPKLNFMANANLRAIYFGREQQQQQQRQQVFEFTDEYLCFFAGVAASTSLYVYDTLDLESGLACTCTMYQMYRHFDFTATLVVVEDEAEATATTTTTTTSYDKIKYKYVPKCIRELGSRRVLMDRLSACLDKRDVFDYCRSRLLLKSERALNATTHLPSPSSLSPPQQPHETAMHMLAARLDHIRLLLIAMVTLTCVLVVLVAVRLLLKIGQMRSCQKPKSTTTTTTNKTKSERVLLTYL